MIYIKLNKMILWHRIYELFIKMLSSLKLTSRTILGKEESKKINTILASLMDSNDSYDFRQPVDWKGMGLLDYGFLIKNPMDLGTVKLKMKEIRYETVEEVLDDIQLVWDNCKAYNPPNTWIHNIAEKLERSFKKMVRNYLPNIPIIVPGRNTGTQREEKKPSQSNLFQEDDREEIPYHEKMKFYEKLRHLPPQDIGKIVQQVMSKCPGAFKQTGDDNAQLLVDNFDPKTFEHLNGMLQLMLLTIQDKNAKKINGE